MTLPKEVGDADQRLALAVLNDMNLVPEHVERRSLYNPAYPKIEQVSYGMLCFADSVTHLSMQMLVHKHTCTHARTHTHTHAHTRTHTHTHTHTHTRAHTHTHTHTHTHSTHTHAHAHTNTTVGQMYLIY